MDVSVLFQPVPSRPACHQEESPCSILPAPQSPPSLCGGAEALDVCWSASLPQVTYPDGSTYIGQTKDGRRHGYGFWKGRNCQYEGQWKDDEQHGNGTQTWNDGRVYDGEFACGKFSGRGRMIWQTPTGIHVYEGSYLNDLRHGAGTFVWDDGRRFDGQWVKGQRHGTGMYINKRGVERFGTWANDTFVPRSLRPMTKRPHSSQVLYALSFRHMVSLCQQIVLAMALVSLGIRLSFCELYRPGSLNAFFTKSRTMFRVALNKINYLPSLPERRMV